MARPRNPFPGCRQHGITDGYESTVYRPKVRKFYTIWICRICRRTYAARHNAKTKENA